MPLRGVIFDLDGTLVDSQLDFAAIRRDLELPPGTPILESLENMTDSSRLAECLAILDEHETRGAEAATLMPGALQFLDELERLGIARAVLTRNSRKSTGLVLNRMGLSFLQVLTREDVAVKPSPEGVIRICENWGFSSAEVLFFGDFLFDIQCGRAAGVQTVLYCPNELPAYANQADFVIRDFSEAILLTEKLA